jgi:hypothetical protein
MRDKYKWLLAEQSNIKSCSKDTFLEILPVKKINDTMDVSVSEKNEHVLKENFERMSYILWTCPNIARKDHKPVETGSVLDLAHASICD